MLSQKKHLIAFMSRAWAPRHRALPIYDKDMLGIIYAVQQWHPYLLGRQFKIITDHRTIKYFLNQRITIPLQQRWSLKLLGYNYVLEYEARTQNLVADALLRQPEILSLMLC